MPSSGSSPWQDLVGLAWLGEKRKGDAMALLSGSLTPLAFAPFGAFYVAPLALVPLFVLWLDSEPGRAALRGWLFGLGMFGFGVSWVHESFQFSEVAMPLAVVLTGLLVLFLSLYPAVTGYLITRFLPQSAPARLLGFFPAAWVLAEWVRGWFLTGFTWIHLGYSQIGWPLAGYAPVVGVYGVSWAVALTAGLMAAALLRKRAWLYAGALVLLWGGGWM